jgi:hypothetical protein
MSNSTLPALRASADDSREPAIDEFATGTQTWLLSARYMSNTATVAKEETRVAGLVLVDPAAGLNFT